MGYDDELVQRQRVARDQCKKNKNLFLGLSLGCLGLAILAFILIFVSINASSSNGILAFYVIAILAAFAALGFFVGYCVMAKKVENLENAIAKYEIRKKYGEEDNNL